MDISFRHSGTGTGYFPYGAANGNVAQGDTVALNAHRNVLSANKGLVVVHGVDDLIVVHTPDATLVCRRDDEQGVRAVVEALREGGLQQYL